MTIEGAIADIQNLIDSDGIPFWAKPSLQKVKETVEAERERYIEERKTGKWKIYVISMLDGEGCRCSECGFEGTPYWEYCPHCGAIMEGAEEW